LAIAARKVTSANWVRGRAGLLRDAWTPSAVALRAGWRSEGPRGRPGHDHHTLAPACPVNRPAVCVTVRSGARSGCRARATTVPRCTVPLACRRSCAARPLPESLASCASSTAHRIMCAGRAPSIYSLREYVVVDDVRSIELALVGAATA